jgi:hypothetical protein
MPVYVVVAFRETKNSINVERDACDGGEALAF